MSCDLESRFQMDGCLGKHGPYTFYKSIKIGDRLVSISTFLPVKIWPDSAILSIADVQLIWTDKNESFCSLKLYFLPENTPDGRLQQHGEDEVIALQDKVIIRVSDLLTWLVEESEWDWGFKTPSVIAPKPLTTALSKSFVSERFQKIDKSCHSPIQTGSCNVVVLNYERYIRLRTILKRLDGSSDFNNWLFHPMVLAIGALDIGPNCRVLYAKEVFDYPELEDHELLCNHLAPKLKGRKRKKNRIRNRSAGSMSNGSADSSSSCSISSDKEKERKVNGMNTNSDIDIKPFQLPLKGDVDITKKPTNVVVPNPNGLQILKIDPQNWCKDGETIKTTKRTFNQANGSPMKPDSSIKGVQNSKAAENIPLGLNGMKTAWDQQGTAKLLGPALSQLAQKLEKSNALQILPIGPSKQDLTVDSDNQIDKKRSKTENSSGPVGPSYQATGPFASRNSIVGPPEIHRVPRTSSSSSDRTQGHIKTTSKNKSQASQSSKKVASQTMPLNKVVKNTASTMCLAGVSPNPFISTRQIYADPYEMTRQAIISKQLHPLLQAAAAAKSSQPDQILDYSKKRSRSSKSSISQGALNVNVNVNVNVEPELLDLSAKSHVQSYRPNHIYHNLADLPPPNAMNQLGLRLTSEVTLFPSHSSHMLNLAKNPTDKQRNKGIASDNNTHIPLGGNFSLIAPPHSSGASSSAGHNRSGQKEQSSSGHSSRKQSNPSSVERSSSHSQSSHSKSVAGSSRDREKTNKEVENINMPLNPFMHPSFYGKMDPAYLTLLGAPQMFLPPAAAAGLMSIPGAMEQFYKDLLMHGQSQSPNLYQNWLPPSGKDRGPKS